jgi:hypothetical protein
MSRADPSSAARRARKPSSAKSPRSSGAPHACAPARAARTAVPPPAPARRVEVERVQRPLYPGLRIGQFCGRRAPSAASGASSRPSSASAPRSAAPSSQRCASRIAPSAPDPTAPARPGPHPRARARRLAGRGGGHPARHPRRPRGFSLSSSATAWRRKSSSACSCGQPGLRGGRALRACASCRPRGAHLRPAGRGPGELVQQRAVAARVQQAPVVMLAVQFHQPVRQRAQQFRPRRPVIDPGCLRRPSGVTVRRRISPSSASIPASASTAVPGWSGARSNSATTSPIARPPSAPDRRARASPAQSPDNPAGWTCRPRFRRSARSSPAATPAKAGRSAACRGYERVSSVSVGRGPAHRPVTATCPESTADRWCAASPARWPRGSGPCRSAGGNCRRRRASP